MVSLSLRHHINNSNIFLLKHLVIVSIGQIIITIIMIRSDLINNNELKIILNPSFICR